ncbi:ARF-GAP domain 5 isoform X2 [Wolffia australiana]
MGFSSCQKTENVQTAKASNLFRGPRWASVNLGIFICMQCSGIHRSLGVHISKVRSATLDTWLPEQVAFIQSMGNDKSNSYWEAELPPNYDRVGIENFIRAKYEEKRWVPKDRKSKPAPEARVEQREHSIKNVTKLPNGRERPSVERSSISAHPKNNSPPEAPKVPSNPKADVVPAPVKPQPAAPATVMAASSPPKVDFADDLFRMLTVNGPANNGSGSTADDNSWAGFQSAETQAAKADVSKQEEIKTKAEPFPHDLFKDQPLMPAIGSSSKPQKDVKNDIMSLFEKTNMVSPFAAHHQQMSLLAQQQQALLLAAAATGGQSSAVAGVSSTLGRVPQQTMPQQTWSNMGYHLPPARTDLSGFSQVAGHRQAPPPTTGGAFTPSLSPGVYTMGLAPPIAAGTPANGSGGPRNGVGSNRPGGDFDFSSLTQGMFPKP